jgi:hypothetical protein
MTIGNSEVLALAKPRSFPANLFANTLRFDFMDTLPPMLSHSFDKREKWSQMEKIQPRLADITVPVISSALSISQPYAALIRAKKYLPHPRHWLKLFELSRNYPSLPDLR